MDRRYSSILVSSMCMCTILVPFSSAIAQTISQAPLDRVLAGVQAPTSEKCEASVAEVGRMIDADPLLSKSADVQNVIATRLQQENGQINNRYRNGISSEDIRDCSESLSLIALRLVPDATPATRTLLISALVTGAYNPESKFAKELALYGEAAVGPVLQLAHSDIGPDRGNAYALMGEMIRAGKSGALRYPFAPQSASRLQGAVRAGLQDPDTASRREAIRAIVAAGDREAIPLLSVLATTDPDIGTGSKARFSVRSLAAEAIKQLQQAR